MGRDNPTKSVAYPIENIPYHPLIIYNENLHDALALLAPFITTTD